MGAGLRQSFVIVFGLIVVGLVSACTVGKLDRAPQTLKIGLVAPFEGLYRPLGYEALFAVKLAVQERNVSQGINGYRVELVALNDFNDPIEAVAQAKALVADPGVLGIVGHLSSATTQAAVPTYGAAKLAVSIPWTVGAIPDERTAGLVRVAADEAETLAYLDLLGLEQGFENIVTLTEPNLDAVSLETEAIKLASDGVTAGMIILALAEANYSLPLFGQVDVGSSQVTEVAKAAANGLIFVSPAPAPIDLPESTAFIEAYQSLAGFPPGPRAALAYDATHILLDSIEQVSLKNGSRPTRAEVSAAIAQVKRLGLTGNIAFDRLGRRLEAPVWIYQIVDQRYPGRLIAP